MPITVQLNGKIRTETGKGAARRLRRGRRLPAVLYGRGGDAISLELDEREFLRTITGHSVSNLIVDLEVEGGESVKSLIREIQTDPVSGSVVHVDLNRISMTEKIDIEVPVETVGVPVGVKEGGGVLQQTIRSLHVRCLVVNIPEVVTVDVSGLHIGDAVHIRDLEIAEVEIHDSPDRTVATVLAPTVVKEEVGEAAEAAEAEEQAEPEVIGKKTEEEGEGGKE